MYCEKHKTRFGVHECPVCETESKETKKEGKKNDKK